MQNQENEKQMGHSKVIKFRAWAIASKEMFYPDEADGWGLMNGSLYPLPNTLIMQFTGLLDKHGKEIYEGDIVKFETLEKENRIMILPVVYFEHETEFCAYEQGMERHKFYSNYTEIIGNIYENPELIKP